jgi:alkylhydroperoxidase family enzyme
MARLPDMDLGKNPDIAESFARVQASRGWVSNLMKSLAHAPDGLQRFQQLGHYARYDTQLTEMQKELTICIIGRNIDYAWTHHGGLARAVGVSAAQLAELKAGRTPQDLGPAERALCDYVFAFSGFGGIPDTTMAAALQHFSPRQITDIALIAAFYTAAGALIMANDVQIEGPEALQTEIDWQRKKMAEARP